MAAQKRRALLIGIDEYDHIDPLQGAANDAKSLVPLLERHADDSKNYFCDVFTPRLTRADLRKHMRGLFENFEGDILFYFAGHGTPTQLGGYLCASNSEEYEEGVAMSDLLQLANQSKADEVLLILDCCFSGALGNVDGMKTDVVQLREGVSILAASRATQSSEEVDGKGVFTQLLVDALSGGAADVQGYVSAAAVYAFIEQALSPWHQRPMYKSHASTLSAIRRCTPKVPDELLRELPALFPSADAGHAMNPSYERTDASANAERVATFDRFKLLRDAGLLQCPIDLYYCALESQSVALTPLGRRYWRLAQSGII
jgi:hypothetical protein